MMMCPPIEGVRGGVVLVADRDPSVQQVLSALIGYFGFEPVAVAEWLATHKSEQRSPVAAILDVRLGTEISGPSMLRTLRERVAKLPCLFVCTVQPPELVRELEALGRARVLLKPMHLDEFRAALSDVLATTMG